MANAWEGYHCCLFAYGQTGAGKSYSMVGYGANKVIQRFYSIRVSFLFLANKSSAESKITKIKANNIKSTSPCSKFIMKKSKTCWFPSLKGLRKDIKSDNTKHLVSMLRGSPNTMLTLMMPSKKKWRKEAGTGPSPPLKWMLLPVEHIRSFPLNSNKNKWLKEKKDRNSLSSILSIWQEVKKSEKLVPQVTDSKKLQVLTNLFLFSVWSSQLLPIKPWEKERTSLFLTETHVWLVFYKMHWVETPKL